MNYSVEWLFEEVYKLKQEKPEEKIHFISDWDIEREESKEFNNVLAAVYNKAGENSFKYNYSYEQFAIKEQIIGYANKRYSLPILQTELSITPSSTISIFLILSGLKELGIKRILVITPTYFSVHDSLKKNNLNLFYFHLRDNKISFTELERVIKEQFIECIILTDPLYSSGIEFSTEDYLALTKICQQNDIYFIVDYSLGGLYWDSDKDLIFNSSKIAILKTNKKYAYIDSLPKRLLLNGIKFSLVIGDENIIDQIDLLAEYVYGGLSSAQCYLIKELYTFDNELLISRMCQDNLKNIKENFNLVQSALLGTDFIISQTNSGFFSMINHKYLKLSEINTRNFAISMLQDKNILCLTKDRFSYYGSSNFGFRINLSKRGDELLFPISQCIGVNYERFQKR